MSKKHQIAPSSWLKSGEFRIYDPTLGYAHPFRGQDDLLRAIPGYDLWPRDSDFDGALNRVATFGGSTSDYREGCRWARFLGELFAEHEPRSIVLNGGCGGYNSHQELQKLLRDAPVLKPTLVVCLSGINDYCGWSFRYQPFYNPFQVEIGQFLAYHTTAFDDFTLGLVAEQKPHEWWLRNGRLMKAIAGDIGAHYLQVLQPTMHSSPYIPLGAELAMWEEEKHGDLAALEDFYREVRASAGGPGYEHVLDLSQIFSGMSGLYRDQRHPNDEGNRMIASAIYKEARGRGYVHAS